MLRVFSSSSAFDDVEVHPYDNIADNVMAAIASTFLIFCKVNKICDKLQDYAWFLENRVVMFCRLIYFAYL